MNDLGEKYWKVSYLNIRVLNCHKDEAATDNFLMSSDIFGFGETWLFPGKTISFSGCAEYFANFGRGEGVAAYSRIDCTLMNSVATESYSAIHIRTNQFDT